jgi:hypothetical protein
VYKDEHLKYLFVPKILFFKVKCLITNILWCIPWIYLFLMKSLSCDSPSVCATVFDQFWERAQLHKTSCFTWSSFLPPCWELRMEILLMEEGSWVQGRASIPVVGKDKGIWHICSEYCHILAYGKTSIQSQALAHVFLTLFRCKHAV